ncbi:MAG TPA: tetratricopeptide repeat protein [Thermoguttaceae bacterium]|nr:tetratricopeptide repeat protein [Thermoguttaceae bacterium]
MKGLNVRLLAILVGGTVVVAACVLVLHRFQVRHQAVIYLDKAREIDDSNNLRQRLKAVEYYRRYIGLNPKDTDALAELGSLYNELADMDPRYASRAFGTLEAVLRNDPLRDDVRRDVIELAMHMEQFNDAREHIELLQTHLPNDGELYQLLAQCQIAEKEYAAAKRSYETAVANKPALLESYVGLAELLRTRYEDLAALPQSPGDDKTKAPATPKKDDAATADAKPGMAKEPAAKKAADAITAKDKRDANAGDQKASAEEQADRWINRMVEKNPKTAKAYRLRAEYFRRTQRLEESQKDVATALKMTPEDQDVLLLAVQTALDKEDYPEGRKHAERAIALFPDVPLVYRTASNLEQRAGNPKRARNWLDKGLTATKDHPTLLWEKANLLITESDLEPVPPIIEQLADSESFFSRPVLIAYLKGRLAFSQKEWAQASKWFEQSRGELDRFFPGMAHQANLCLVECYNKLNRPDQARRILGELRQASSGRRATAADSWKQLAATGQIPQALSACRELLKRPDAPPTLWVDLAKLSLYYNERVPESRRDWTEAEDALKQALELTPEDPELPILQAQLLMDQHRMGEAQKVLEDAVKREPVRWDLWDRLIILAQLQKEWDRAAKLIDEAERHISAKKPEEPESDATAKTPDVGKRQWVAKTSVYLARARLAVARDGEKAAEELKQLGKKTEEMTASEKSLYLRMLSGFCLQIKNFEQAKIFCQKAADQDPSNLQIRILLVEIARQVQDEAAMRQVVDEIGKIEQNGPMWHYYTAQLLVLFDKNEDKKPNYRKAVEHLNQARLGRPDWGEVPMFLGKLQQRLGDKTAAVESYQRAVELGSRDPSGIGDAAQLLYAEGRADEGGQMLRLLEQSETSLPVNLLMRQGQQRLLEGDLKGGADNFQQAAEELRKQVKDSDDYRQYLNLSQVVHALAQIAKRRDRNAEAAEYFEETEKNLRKAIELSPKSGELWILLVALLDESGKVGQFSEVLAQARNKLPDDQVAMTLARCYEVMKRYPEAEQEYEKAYEENKDNKNLARLTARFYLQFKDPQKQKRGEDILRDMLGGKRPAEKTDVAWARRQLAVLLSTRGSHPDYREAMESIDANLKEDPQSTVDKRLKARLLSRRPSRAERRQAQELFKELVALPKSLPDDHYQLARLYFAEEKWNDASNEMQPLLASKTVEPEWLDFYIRAQIRADEYAGAEAKLDRYATMVADPFVIAVIRARILSGRKRHMEAIQVLQEYVDNPSPLGVSRPTRLRQAAQALDNLAKRVPGPGRDAAVEQYLKQAERYLREYVEKDPDNSALLVSFLGHQGRHDEALKLAEQAWEKNQPLVMVVSAVALLTQGNPSPGEIQRVEKILAAAIDKNQKEAADFKKRLEPYSNSDESAEARTLRAELRAREGAGIALLLAEAELMSIQRRYDEAEEDYRKVLAAEPNNVVALNNLAVFLSLRGLKLDEAFKMIDRAIELAGPVATLLDSRATVYLAQGKWQESLDDLSLALAEEPTAVRHFHQAQAYALGKKRAEALAAMARADRLGLKIEQLQPLERPSYRQLKEDLK